ncbi:MAG: riboflavin biosynthesis protein RibF [Muribaculaceae bacterium]|nr:riboflavin biosynthesis protein RibF [Muribaculaceae bacterium]
MDKAATIGSFDGMHRGHLKVLEVLKEESGRRGLLPMAITFDRHPLELIAPERAPGNLMTAERKIELISDSDVVPILLPFTEQLRNTRVCDWLRYIRVKYDVRLVVLGYDNTFGSDGRDLTFKEYVEIGEATGVEIVCAPEVEGISSSAVRKAVKEGDIPSAIRMLGHLPELEGRVASGFKVGREIGFPTANLQVSPRLVKPLAGVYAAYAHIEGFNENSPLPAMVNIGVRPTFDGTATSSLTSTVEAHIIGFDEDLYGKKIRLEFASRLRDERRFDSVDDLRRQLNKDREAAIQCLSKA